MDNIKMENTVEKTDNNITKINKDDLIAYMKKAISLGIDVKKAIQEASIESFKDISDIEGWYISERSTGAEIAKRHKKVVKDTTSWFTTFSNKEAAESAQTLAPLSQILAYYNTCSNSDRVRFAITPKINGEFSIEKHTDFKTLFDFTTEEEALRFLNNNRDLLKKHFQI